MYLVNYLLLCPLHCFQEGKELWNWCFSFLHLEFNLRKSQSNKVFIWHNFVTLYLSLTRWNPLPDQVSARNSCQFAAACFQMLLWQIQLCVNTAAGADQVILVFIVNSRVEGGMLLVCWRDATSWFSWNPQHQKGKYGRFKRMADWSHLGCKKRTNLTDIFLFFYLLYIINRIGSSLCHNLSENYFSCCLSEILSFVFACSLVGILFFFLIPLNWNICKNRRKGNSNFLRSSLVSTLESAHRHTNLMNTHVLRYCCTHLHLLSAVRVDWEVVGVRL